MRWIQRCVHWLFWWCALQPFAHAALEQCQPHILSVHAARALTVAAARPSEGWEAITLPDRWTLRWPSHSGSVWYRIDWDTGCTDPQALSQHPLGLLVAGITMAGALYLNDDLLWRDASLTAPISQSWNMPRWWTLPASALRAGRNTIWFHVVGVAELAPGLHLPQLGPAQTIETAYENLLWRKRTAYGLACALSTAVATIFFVVWCLRRQERAFGWFALMGLCWMLYQASVLAVAPWPVWVIPAVSGSPFPETLTMARLNLMAMVLYTHCSCIFTFRFGAQTVPRLERILWGLTGLTIAALLLIPLALQEDFSKLVLLGCALVFLSNCLQFVWHACRTRQPQHLLLALCWSSFLVVGTHDLWLVLQEWHAHETWSPFTSMVTTVFMAILLGSRLASSTREVEVLNQSLEQRIAQARTELNESLEREHQQMLQHTRLQERVQLAHDLHDSLGGSLVRSIAVVERAKRTHQPLENERMLSLLKLLRNDLRQIIDYGSVSAAPPPSSPEQWLAPLRYRFSRIFDELHIAWDWPLDSEWHSTHCRPSALQCLNIERIVEEALTNTLKHAQASHIRVRCEQSVVDALLTVCIEDNGTGFEVCPDEEISGLHVGLRSMRARAQHCGASLKVQSTPGLGTHICLQLRWQPPVTNPTWPPTPPAQEEHVPPRKTQLQPASQLTPAE